MKVPKLVLVLSGVVGFLFPLLFEVVLPGGDQGVWQYNPIVYGFFSILLSIDYICDLLNKSCGWIESAMVWAILVSWSILGVVIAHWIYKIYFRLAK